MSATNVQGLERRADFAASRRTTVILDVRGNVVMSGGELGDFVRSAGAASQSLRPDIAEIAAEHMRRSGNDLRVSFVEPHWLVRTQALGSQGEAFYALSIELIPNVDALSCAAQRFGLTRRELDVLTLMLDGFVAAEIAETLDIAEGTVQVYYKRLLSKTQSRNRTSMVAQVLSWYGGAARERNIA